MRLVTWVITLAVVNVLNVTSAPAAILTYQAVAVPASPNLITQPSGINDSGQVVGSFQDFSGVLHGFIRSADGQSYVTVDIPGSSYTTALTINSQGDVAGLFALPFGRAAVYVRSADGNTITTPSIADSPVNIYALGLNSNRQMVGYYQQNGQFRSFFCSLTTASCGQLTIPGFDVTVAQAVNDQGQVVGYVSQAGLIRAFLLNPDGSMVVFDEPDATISTIATGISNNGLITGYFLGITGEHNFLRSPDGSAFTSFDYPGVKPGNSYATGVNNAGSVVGYCVPAFDEYQGFLGVSTTGSYPVSDNFNGTALNTGLWTFVNPKGDGSYVLNGSELLLNATGGSDHDAAYGGINNSPHLVQPVADSDFTVEAKFDSIPQAAYQFEGIVVEQDASSFLRFQIGSSVDSLGAGASSVLSQNEADLSASLLSIPPGTVSLWLRVQRAGDTWTETWSTDGITYFTAASFTQPLKVSAVGPFAGNFGDTPSDAPAFTAAIDYFLSLPVASRSVVIP